MANKIWPFTIPANYIYNPGKIEIADGLAKLRKSSWLNVYANWHLNEESGATAADSSGNNRHGSLINMENQDWKTGKLNNCLEFDGINEYVIFGDIADFERTDSFSLELWFKTGNAGSQDLLNRMMAAMPFTGWAVYMNSGVIQFYLVSNYGPGNYILVMVNENFADNFWHHLVVIYDGSSAAAGIHIYVDGNDKALVISRDALIGSIHNAVDLRLAARDRPLYLFDGQMDEVVIYDKELTPGEIAARWNSGNGIEETPGDTYPIDKPTIRPSSSWQSFGLTELTAFLQMLGPGNQGSIRYQLSEDNGTTWLYWNGIAWIAAGENEYNDAATVHANIESFPINEDKIIFKAFLISDGSQKVELDSIRIIADKIIDVIQDIKAETDKISAVKVQTDQISSLKTLLELIEEVEIGEWLIAEDVLFFLDPTGQVTIASFQLHYDNKGNVIRRERIS